MNPEIQQELVRIRTILDEVVVPQLKELKTLKAKDDDLNLRVDRLEQASKRTGRIMGVLGAVLAAAISAAASLWPHK